MVTLRPAQRPQPASARPAGQPCRARARPLPACRCRRAWGLEDPVRGPGRPHRDRRRNTRPPLPRSAACSRSWPAPAHPWPGRRSAGTSCRVRWSAWIPSPGCAPGLVTNPGMFVLGQPGTGKSTLVKRLVTGAVATGGIALILGDTKPDYTLLTEHLGGQVIRIGRGLDRINPLDTGPLGQALRRMPGQTPTRCGGRSAAGGCPC